MKQKDFEEMTNAELEARLKEINKYFTQSVDASVEELDKRKREQNRIKEVLEERHINNLMLRLDSTFSSKDIVCLISNMNKRYIDDLETLKLLRNILTILETNDKKSEVVVKIFNSFSSVKEWKEDTFDVTLSIPKKLRDGINLRADEIRLENSCKKETADELYEELTR